ncbi:MAG: DUF6988 family protein [Rhodanobacteraceae bacterium]
MTAVGEIELGGLNELSEIARTRALVAATLLKASSDHGLAISTLLAASLEGFAAPALALHRTQIETYARGVFFRSAATDDELVHFLRKDEMPKRTRSNGKRTTITAKEVLHAAALAEDVDPAKLQSMMDHAWRNLSGMVHGGRPTLATYRTTKAIGASLDARGVRALLGNTGVLTIMACSGICGVREDATEAMQTILARISAASDAIGQAVKLPAIVPTR